MTAGVLLSLQFRTPAHGMVPRTGKVLLVTSTNLILIIPPRHTQKLNAILEVCLEASLLGDSRTYHIDNINHQTGQCHALSLRF